MNGVLYAGDNIDHLVDWDDDTNAEVINLYIYGLNEEYTIANGTPVETFNGDGSGSSTGWEVTMPAGVAIEEVFEADVIAVTSEVAENANTVGPDASGFGWTWAGDSGALSDIGL